MIIIHQALVHEALLLTELARNIYKEYYLHLWHTGGAEWYMEEYAYSSDAIKKDLTDLNIEYFIAVEDGSPVGYMKIVLNSPFEADENMNALEVERIYLTKKVTGRGLGRQFMELALRKALELKKDIIFLKAMDSSKDAIEFYKRLGYTVCGSLQLPLPAFSVMKKEYRGMVILKKRVEE